LVFASLGKGLSALSGILETNRGKINGCSHSIVYLNAKALMATNSEKNFT
jgi:hypothetical protein